jgi:hypothetical protein
MQGTYIKVNSKLVTEVWKCILPAKMLEVLVCFSFCLKDCQIFDCEFLKKWLSH